MRLECVGGVGLSDEYAAYEIPRYTLEYVTQLFQVS